MGKFLFLFLLFFSNVVEGQELNEWKELASDLSLREYLESSVYDKLSYTKINKDSIISKLISISHSEPGSIVTIRDVDSIAQKPMIIINGVLLKENKIPENITLSMTSSIALVNPEKSVNDYGWRAMYGVIIININKKAFRKIKKNIR